MDSQMLILKLELLGDALFGRGDGIAGLIDQDIAHDALGLPYLHGRGVKGLLRARCQEVLSALELALPGRVQLFRDTEIYLFGRRGSDLDANAALAFGPARLSDQLARALNSAQKPQTATADIVLSALTSIRRQTSIDESTGAAAQDTLRSARVLRRGLVFYAPVYAPTDWPPRARGLLAASVMALRRVGARRA
ncbi:MAG: RAMP superfamily CRISPR-associated protein, partial [Candidatus Roseilinea sp.]|uniref:RAMP superfamily CRISPR-associated protein n=1 Tax=Candidatus Roseilinea sp. TaxID=2838777 RepID=UPI00404B6EF7